MLRHDADGIDLDKAQPPLAELLPELSKKRRRQTSTGESAAPPVDFDFEGRAMRTSIFNSQILKFNVRRTRIPRSGVRRPERRGNIVREAQCDWMPPYEKMVV